MPRSRLLPIAAALIALGSSAAAAQGVRINFKASTEPVLLDTLRQDHDIKAPPERVYAATLKAFEDIGIPVGNTDNKHGIIGSERFEASRVLAGAPMSRSFECGDAATGPIADQFRIELAVVAFIAPNTSGGTTVGLASVGSARDTSGPTRPSRMCSSTGRIEMKLLERIQRLTGG